MLKFAGKPLARARAPLTACLTLAVTCAAAQVVRDGSVGPPASVQPTGPAYVIDESMGRRVGGSLFHSFTRFDLSATHSATFTAVGALENILSRITGGEASFIDGGVVSNVPGANLFLLNPSGIVFGENAAVDVDGSFHASTAHWVEFDSGERFESGAGGRVPTVTTARPEAFGFLGSAAAITLRGGEIQVADGADLSVIGGRVRTDGASLAAAGGRVSVVAVASDARVSLADPGNVGAVRKLESIRLGPQSEIDVGGDPAGSVILRARDVVLDGASVSATSEGAAAGSSPAIDLGARRALSAMGDAEIAASSEGAGRGGDVLLSAARIEIAAEAGVASDTEGAGRAGRVLLRASEITLSGDAELSSDVEAGAGGAGGEVAIRTQILTLLDDSEISTDTDPASTGEGGRIDIQASRGVRLQIRTEPGEQAGILSNSEGEGEAGSIRIATAVLSMDGGVITAQTEGAGDGGNVHVRAGEVLITNGASISALSRGEGDAGNIGIQSAGRLLVTEGAGITAQSGISDGGNISIDAASGQVLLRRSGVSANVNDGVGGNVLISAAAVAVDHGRIVAQAGDGRGGEILVDTGYFINDGGVISASAGPAGISGTVTIDAADVELSSDLQTLASDYLDAAGILTSRCAERRRGTRASSLTVGVRRVLPASVEGLPVGESQGSRLSATARAVLELSLVARDELFARRPGKAAQRLRQARKELPRVAQVDERVYLTVHVAAGLGMLSDLEPRRRSGALLDAHQLLTGAVQEARADSADRALSFALGNLGRLYAREHRHAEALYLVRQALQAARRARAPEAIYRWHWLAGRWLWAQGRSQEAVDEYRRAVRVLDAVRPLGPEDTREADHFSRALAPVYRDLVGALLDGAARLGTAAASEAQLVSALETLERYRAAELRQYFQDECVADVSVENVARGVADAGVAVLHPIVLADRTELLLSVSGQILRRSVPVSADRLAFQIRSLRRGLERPSSQAPPRAARTLYDWLLRPLRSELVSRQIHTLVVVPDGALRGIPMAALHDGQRYLVESLALAVAPGLSLVDLRPIGDVALTGVAAGVSEAVDGFQALPRVRDEVREVAERLDGEALLDEEFRSERLRTVMLELRPNVVHIASHAVFGSSASTSFILTYDDRINLQTLQRYVQAGRTGEVPLELLVLSACETASGDDRSALGLAGMAVRAGARSALGSLWSISDEAASRLVSAFYAQLGRAGATRAGALQAAQLELIADPRYRHPFFWSPFLLINNWR